MKKIEELFDLRVMGQKVELPKSFFNESNLKKHDSVITTMALIVNDLKGIIYWYMHLEADENNFADDAGALMQIGYMKNQIFKQLAAIGIEAIKFLEKIKKDDCFKDQIFSETEKKLGKGPKIAWDTLFHLSSADENVQISTDFGNISKKDLKDVLFTIRSKGTYHYDDLETMVRGMTSALSKKVDRYFFYGDTFEKTRFIFADEGIYHFSIDSANDRGIPKEQVANLSVGMAKLIHRAFASYCFHYLNLRRNNS